MSELSQEARLKIGEWLTHGSVGASSKSIAIAALTGYCPKSPHYPYDSYDFQRCAELINRVPECQKPAFELLCKRGNVWPKLIEQWNDILESLEREWKPFRSVLERQSTPETNAKIRKITQC